jgi:glycosyltransferase involved in cell wall biosynthesis
VTAPRITLAVLAYNQSSCIEAAVGSALAQVCEPVEILLSDDASTDDSFARMAALAAGYRGPHQVSARRNERNLGVGGHYNEIVRLARGSLLVTMAGDDISVPQRVARIAAAWDDSGGRLDLIASHLLDMTPAGRLEGMLRVDDLSRWHGAADWARARPYVIGAAHAFTKRIFERFGPLDARLTYEDQVITFRALLSGGARTIDEPLVQYRRGGLSAGAPSRAERRAHAGTMNERQLIEHEQIERDARMAGMLDVVGPAIERNGKRLRYFDRLLAAPDLAARWRIFAASNEVPWGWRWRKFWASAGSR